MLVCVAVTDEGLVDPRWRRTERMTIVKVEGGTILSSEKFAVSWGSLRQSGSERTHHSRVAHFLGQHRLDSLLTRDVGENMRHILDRVLEAFA
jgi:predicted Fe-Mo cluster-binding NifX family protein